MKKAATGKQNSGVCAQVTRQVRIRIGSLQEKREASPGMYRGESIGFVLHKNEHHISMKVLINCSNWKEGLGEEESYLMKQETESMTFSDPV